MSQHTMKSGQPIWVTTLDAHEQIGNEFFDDEMRAAKADHPEMSTDELAALVIEEEDIQTRWFYAPCHPECMPDGSFNGPYDTEDEAIKAAKDEDKEYCANAGIETYIVRELTAEEQINAGMFDDDVREAMTQHEFRLANMNSRDRQKLIDHLTETLDIQAAWFWTEIDLDGNQSGSWSEPFDTRDAAEQDAEENS